MRKVDESMLLHIVIVDFAMAASENSVCITQQKWHGKQEPAALTKNKQENVDQVQMQAHNVIKQSGAGLALTARNSV
jgi:hypothetical protein